MQRIGDRFVYSASDLNDFVECRYLAHLKREVAFGRLVPPERTPTLEMIATKGEEHEQRHLKRLKEFHGDQLVAFEDRPERAEETWRAAEARAIEAMAAGARIIYQATFYDGTFLGRADFLRRVERPCARWEWSYEVIDTKLALTTRPYFLIQLCNYSEHLARIQEMAPEHCHVVLGSGREESYRLDEFGAYYRHLKAEFLANVAHLEGLYPNQIAHCARCDWNERCEKRREADDHLSLVAFMRSDQIEKFVDAGIRTLTALAGAADGDRPYGMVEPTFRYLRAQACEQLKQHRARAAGAEHPYSSTHREIADDAGFAKLPPPAPGDVFFDIEGDPLYAPGQSLEYLFGLYLPDEDEYVPFWGTEPTGERTSFEALIDFIVARLRRFPEMHVYHYAPYESSALKRLMGRHGTREHEVDNFLRRGLLVDLYPVVRQSQWISQPSYSLKKVEKLYRMQRAAITKHGDDSIVMFETWRDTREQGILDDIARYNEEDCRSTHGLREWLLERRADLEAASGTALPWRKVALGEETPDDDEGSALERALLEGLVPPASLADVAEMSDTHRVRWLLANMLRYHKREAKPAWWEYFNRLQNPSQLAEFDDATLGGLVRDESCEPRKLGTRDRNLVYAFDFPEQEHRIAGRAYAAPTGAQVTVVSLDEQRRRIVLKMAKELADVILGLVPSKPIPDAKKRATLERIAETYLAGDLERAHPAVYDVLLGRPPRIADRRSGARIQPVTVTEDAVVQLIGALERSYLFVQGPPGSGKSTIAAGVIVRLLRDGKRVGLMSQSHKAVHNLLDKIEETALKRGIAILGAHKESETDGSAYGSRFEGSTIISSDSYDDVCVPERTLVSGTSFAWADDRFADFDYVFVDEAGQISLADALIAASKAANVVLLGDPLQLPQVTQGSHPPGTDRSVLEHLLGDAETVREDRGVFLDVTYRLAPPIADFISSLIYEGRLRGAPATARNRIESAGLQGNGLRYLPIEHSGNSRYAMPEVERIVAEVGQLLRSGTVTLNGDPARPLEASDILIVAPFNLQRTKISAALAAAAYTGIRVGTVDKFQGQQAPVVFYSMTSSSGEEAPRGVGFLFDKNRFNVAISRAQCLSVLVCSPRLLEVPCNEPAQMRLVNLLCAFAEAATEVRDERVAPTQRDEDASSPVAIPLPLS